VTQEPAELEAFRREVEKSEKASEPLTPAHVEAIGVPSRKVLPEGISNEVAAAKLEEVLNSAGASATAKANALALLLLVDDKKGQERVVAICQQGDSELKRQVLLNLSFLDDQHALRITDPALIRELHQLIRSPEFGPLAMNICVGFAVPGTLEEIWKCAPESPAELRPEMAFWLSRLKLDRRTFEFCSEGLSGEDKGRHYRYLTAMEHFVEGEDQALAQEVLERMADDLLQTLSRKKVSMLDFPQGACGTVLQKGRGEKAKKLVDQILADFQERDSYLYQLAYTAKRQGEPDLGVSRLLNDLADNKQGKSAREAIMALYADSGNPQIADALWGQIQRVKQPQDLFMLGRALLTVGGDNAVARCKTLALQMPDPEKQALLREMAKDSPLILASRFIGAGFLVSNQVEAVIAHVREYQEEYYGKGALRKMDAQEFLIASKLVAHFDVETDELPVRHDKLIRELASISGGVFAPACCRETFVKAADKKDPFEQPYHVAFIHGDRLYRFVARNFGDWYDLERVLIACNKALEEQGVPQRFRELEGDGQCAAVAFITPEQESLLRDAFYVVFGKDPNTAMEKGKAFEDQVRKQLR